MKPPLPTVSERRRYGLPEALTELLDGNHPIRTISDQDLADYIQRKEKLLTTARQQLEATMKRVALERRDVLLLEGALKQSVDALHHLLTGSRGRLPKLKKLAVTMESCGSLISARREYLGWLGEIIKRASSTLEELDLTVRRYVEVMSENAEESVEESRLFVEGQDQPKIRLKKLRFINLSPEEMLSVIGESSHTTLEILDVSRSSAFVGRRRLQSLLSGDYPQLVVLNLSAVRLTADCGGVVGSFLRGRCPKLKRLDLSDNSEMGNDAFKEIIGQTVLFGRPAQGLSGVDRQPLDQRRTHPCLVCITSMWPVAGILGAEGGEILGSMVQLLMLAEDEGGSAAIERVSFDNNQLGNDGLQRFLDVVGYGIFGCELWGRLGSEEEKFYGKFLKNMSSSVEVTNCAFDYIVEAFLAAASAEGHLDSGVLVVVGCAISSDGRTYFNQHRSESEGVSYFTAEAMDDLVDILRKRLLRLLEKMQVLQVLASVAVFSDSAGSSTQSPLSRSVAATRCDPTFRAIRNILCLCDVHAQELLGLGDELILEMAMYAPKIEKSEEKSDGAMQEVIENLRGRGMASSSDVAMIHPAAAVVFEWVLLAYEAKLEVKACMMRSGSAAFASQLAASSAIVGRTARSPPVFVMPRRNESSFIRQVMEQVRKDAESDPELKKALDDMSKTKTRGWPAVGALISWRVTMIVGVAMQVSDTRQRTKNLFEELRKQMPHADEAKEGSTAAKPSRLSQLHVPDWMKSAGESAKKVGVKVLDRTTAFVNMMTKESKEGTAKRQEEFHRSQEAARQAAKDEAIREAAAEDPDVSPREKHFDVGSDAAPIPEHPHANALVVSDKQRSTWERFGFNTSDSEDSKFLGGFFDNPMLDRVFGETEIAQSIREMKETDPHFRLSQLVEDVENVVAPSLIKWFLEGDAEDLKLHCGEAAFAAVNASIEARKNQKLSLDPTILQGPEDLELKGAKSGGEVDSPCFIFTFSTQQINCLRNEKDEVVEGAIDDIRQVFYAMAVQKHPEPNTPGLKFPWRMQEIAILGNQPCW
ncbi:Mitochondrial import inner membrane translocase subunit TIM44 [Perkinsus olseni]|uniref:Mitochondrial import inner membrane translocase subunit TIM44 n=1 Tax=Perkinsus olseni TaxID=32597 RepID=A0A7J6NY33_PEROL|nr:Mitochondrial import inner membrane translocase subunit TIM44 [Perkinsus olseni]